MTSEHDRLQQMLKSLYEQRSPIGNIVNPHVVPYVPEKSAAERMMDAVRAIPFWLPEKAK